MSSASIPVHLPTTDPRFPAPAVTDNIRQALQGLRFGQVTINVQDGEIIRIERLVRIRQFRSTAKRAAND